MNEPPEKRQREPVPGGRALERLHQFEQARGLPLSDIQASESQPQAQPADDSTQPERSPHEPAPDDKALERLHQSEQARGLPLSDIQAGEPQPQAKPADNSD